MTATLQKIMRRVEKNLVFNALVVLSMGGMTLVFADDQPRTESPLQSELRAFVVETTEDGEEKFNKAADVEPGKLVEYRLLYKNASEAPLTDIMVVGPIAAGTDYVEGSATVRRQKPPKFSLDGGRTFQPEPVIHEVESADGTIEKREVAPEMYTHIRWHIVELEPEETTELRYRVRVR